MFCPKCKFEYRPGFDTCSDCKVPLVDELPVKKTPKNKPGWYTEEIIGSPAYLTTVDDPSTAAVMQDILHQNGIPSFRKYRDPAGVYLNIYMGNIHNGVDIFVPDSALEQAKKLIEIEIPVEDQNEITENASYDEDDFDGRGSDKDSEDGGKADDYKDDDFSKGEVEDSQKKRRRRAWILLLLFFFPAWPIVLAYLLVKWMMKKHT